MRRAIDLAREGVAQALGGPFGAVIAREGEVLAVGQNRVTSSGDPTAHAEVVAIRAACERVGGFSLEGCEIYASSEPCPMCLAAIHWARIDRLWFACSREDAADAGFDDALLYDELALEPDRRRLPSAQLLRDEALASFRDWAAKADRIPY
ncbi:MAG: nucleoside deaminase [Planctomycetota bacterium]|nr:nucleoside deaminase [Planctomycetota bacterium]MDP6763730.1 nucleoside deaminase [Planctomycetota bacterium]MDP6989244.1 nucleoside deaminase [Planctomycetota bacterium]